MGLLRIFPMRTQLSELQLLDWVFWLIVAGVIHGILGTLGIPTVLNMNQISVTLIASPCLL